MRLRAVTALTLAAVTAFAGASRADSRGRDRHDRRVESDRMELGLRDRSEGTALTSRDRKIGWVRAEFTDTEGRYGSVDVSVKNDSDCRMELTLYVYAHGRDRHQGDRESKIVRVGRNERERTRVRFELHHSERPRVVVDTAGRLFDCR